MQPIHINASAADMTGNSGRGRYILLPGSNGRAEEIAGHFENVRVLKHSRSHDCWLGEIYTDADQRVDVMAVASGMGCPSMEIILHELYTLGARRFLRVGTAGSMQPERVLAGDLVSASASVRDESTTRDYVPPEFPAVASTDMLMLIREAAAKTGLDQKLHEGTVHCKASFYAREFGAGPQASDNRRYTEALTQAGVLATEMETATLFVQGSVYRQSRREEEVRGGLPAVMTGAVLGIVSVPPHVFLPAAEQRQATEDTIVLALETLRVLAAREVG